MMRTSVRLPRYIDRVDKLTESSGSCGDAAEEQARRFQISGSFFSCRKAVPARSRLAHRSLNLLFKLSPPWREPLRQPVTSVSPTQRAGGRPCRIQDLRTASAGSCTI